MFYHLLGTAVAVYLLILCVYHLQAELYALFSKFVPSVSFNGPRMASLNVAKPSIQIYIYNWSEELTNCWPTNFSHARLSFESKFSENYFEGPAVDSSKHLFHTHQYSLYQIVLQRIKLSTYITKDPMRATHFLIPYDLGKELFQYGHFVSFSHSFSLSCRCCLFRNVFKYSTK
jgi:hypothetical protein